MKKNFESIKSKSKRIANGFLLQLLFYCSPGIHLDPYVSAYALIWTPILLIFSIITVTDIFSITSKDIRIISFIVDRTLKNITLRNSEFAIHLISISYVLIIIYQNTGNQNIALLVMSFSIMAIAILLIVEENIRVWMQAYQTTTKLSLSVISAISIYWASILASSQINNMFLIDAESFKYTDYALVAYNLLKISLPVFSLILFFAIYINKKSKTKFIPTPKYVFITALFMLLQGVSMLTDKITNQFIERVALNTDFNSKNICKNKKLNISTPVIYIDKEYRHVLYRDNNDSKLPYKITECL